MKRWIITGIVITVVIAVCVLLYINKEKCEVIVAVSDSALPINLEKLLNLPPEELITVTNLSISYNQDIPPSTTNKELKEIPPIVSQLINLKEFYCVDNEISDLTPIKHLIHLEAINLSGNKITNLKDFENFTNLTGLDVSNNQLTDLKGIEKLKKLQYLDLVHNHNLSDLTGIESLTNLKELIVGYNDVKTFPDSFYTTGLPIEIIRMWKMPNFEYASNLPKFHKLKELRTFILKWNNVPVLNIDFEKCENLETFSYSTHEEIDIADVLNRISKAPKLDYLILSDNNIRYLPENIVLPDSLEVLHLSHNKIKRLPMNITKYKKLKSVHLHSNPIDTIAIKKIEKAMVNTEFHYDKR